MTYSLDFREKVLSVYREEELTIAEVASRFCVGVASIVRWLKRVEPCRTRIKPATKIDMIALARDIRTRRTSKRMKNRGILLFLLMRADSRRICLARMDTHPSVSHVTGYVIGTPKVERMSSMH